MCHLMQKRTINPLDWFPNSEGYALTIGTSKNQNKLCGVTAHTLHQIVEIHFEFSRVCTH